MVVTHPADLFYLSGDSSELLYVPAEGPVLRAADTRLAFRGNTTTGIERLAERVREEFGRMPRVLGLELDVLSLRRFMEFRRIFRGGVLIDTSKAVLGARMIKSGWELERMEWAAERTAQVFAWAREAMRPGLTEIGFAGMLEARAGALGLGSRVRVRDYRTEGYPWHVLAGRSGGRVGVLDAPATGDGTSAAFPCGAGYRQLAPGEPVMVDFVTLMDGYHMDETRMLSMCGLSPKAEKACRAAIEIHDHVLEKVKPGCIADELFQSSVDIAASLGYHEAYLGPPGRKVRFVGHGIGVELIEPPLIAAGHETVLKPGMTFALEPKMVFEGEFAAGIESVVTVTETGCRRISRVPVEVFYA